MSFYFVRMWRGRKGEKKKGGDRAAYIAAQCVGDKRGEEGASSRGEKEERRGKRQLTQPCTKR